MLLVGVGEGELSQAMSLCVYLFVSTSTLNLTAYNPILNSTVTMRVAACGNCLPPYEENFSFERWIGPLFLEISEAYVRKCMCICMCRYMCI